MFNVNAVVVCYSLLFLIKTCWPCPVGYHQWQSNCYYLSTAKLTWADSETYCASGDGHLTSVENAMESNLIGGFKHKRVNYKGLDIWDDVADISSGFDDVWNGGNNLEDDTNWQWSDGRRFNYTRWKPGMPIDASNNQCIAFNKPNAYWINDNCHARKRFICKFSQSLFPVSSTTPSSTGMKCNCPLGYETYQGNCYKVFHNMSNWDNAENACVRENAHLASIHSEQEAYYIQGLVINQTRDSTADTCSANGQASHMWIGFRDPLINNNYIWSDETDASFRKWYSGPATTQCGTGVHCALIFSAEGYYGLWQSYPCSMRLAFYVCKKPAQ